MEKKFINSLLRVDYVELLNHSIQVYKIEKESHPKFKAFRISYLNPDVSTTYVYLDEKDRDSDMRLLQLLLAESD